MVVAMVEMADAKPGIGGRYSGVSARADYSGYRCFKMAIPAGGMIDPIDSIDPAHARFYSLIWQPAAVMHTAWWQVLALASWQLAYVRIPHCRRWVNQRIALQRGFPIHGASHELDPLERQLLGISEKLPALLLALGLLRLPQPEYKLLKPYREAVQCHLDTLACSQLAVISAAPAPAEFHLDAPLVEPARLVDVAMRAGAAVLTSKLADSVALRAVELLLAPGCFDGERLAEPAISFGWDTLFRLIRFL
jgi:hypothetical protein